MNVILFLARIILVTKADDSNNHVFILFSSRTMKLYCTVNQVSAPISQHRVDVTTFLYPEFCDLLVPLVGRLLLILCLEWTKFFAWNEKTFKCVTNPWKRCTKNENFKIYKRNYLVTYNLLFGLFYLENDSSRNF